MVDGHSAPDSFVFKALYKGAEGVVVATVQGGDVETGVPFPEAPARLGAGEDVKFVGEFIVVACEAGVEFPVPDEFVLWVSKGKMLDGEPLGAMDAV